MESRINSPPKMPYAFGLNPFVFHVLPGGGDGYVPFFGVSFSLIFPGTRYEKRSIFLEPFENCD